jgi:hypothetical protein
LPTETTLKIETTNIQHFSQQQHCGEKTHPKFQTNVTVENLNFILGMAKN